MTANKGRGPRRRGAPASRGRSASRPPRAAARRRTLRPGRAARFALVALAAAAGVGLLAVVLVVVIAGRTLSAPPGPPIAVHIPAGVDERAVAAILAERGVCDAPWLFAAYVRLLGRGGAIAPGPHLVRGGLTLRELEARLSRDPGRPRVRVTIPEGFHRFDIGARLERLEICPQEELISASEDARLLAARGLPGPSAEGHLFPATYELPVNSAAAEVVRRLVEEAGRRWAALAATHAPALSELGHALGWGRQEVITLASIVEKEAAVDEERPLIASVFLNRLRRADFTPRKLQADPTAMYGCLATRGEIPACAGYSGKASRAINLDPANRYSTYVNEGLPPGPIANPGARSIEAVLAPAATRYLYFVSRGGGRHQFSESLPDHNEAVRKLRTRE